MVSGEHLHEKDSNSNPNIFTHKNPQRLGTFLFMKSYA